MAVASTFDKHVIIVGLGHLGCQTLKNLISMDLDVVIIELDPDASLVSEVQALGVPVLADDANKQTALMNAGITKANTIILCTQNDSLNMEIAIKAKALNPKLKVVARVFDQQFAKAIEEQFDFIALSSSVMSAPSFAAAAAGMEMTQPINIEGNLFSLARLDIPPLSKLIGTTAGSIEQNFAVSLVLINRKGHTELHPHSEATILPGDNIAVLATPSEIKQIIKANENK